MNKKFNTLAACVLAAGKGKRIGHHLPKVLYPIMGKPMLYYSLELVNKIPVHDTYVVVGNRMEDVKASLRNEKVNYVYQAEQLGTGHAVGLVLNQLPQDVKELIVFNGDDSAFFEAGTIRSFIQSHIESDAKISFITSKVDNPAGLGRVVRDVSGEVVKIVEEKDAMAEEKEITEVNVGCYIVDVDWAKDSIKKIVNTNGSGEYYITDLVFLALQDGRKVGTLLLTDSNEWRGVNTQDELHDANSRMLARLQKRKIPTVFIFDIDNTIINTDALKEYIGTAGVKSLFKESEIESFWHEYEKIRGQLGYISIPDLSDSFAQITGNESYAGGIRKLFYGINFEEFVYEGVEELMEYVDSKGEIVILSEGDLVYQPMKIKNLRITRYLDEMFVFESKKDHIGDIINVYKGRRQIYIDDKITDLEVFKKSNPDAFTIHLKQGVYKNLEPLDPGFTPDLVTTDFSEVLRFIKSLY